MTDESKKATFEDKDDLEKELYVINKCRTWLKRLDAKESRLAAAEYLLRFAQQDVKKDPRQLEISALDNGAASDDKQAPTQGDDLIV